MAQLLDGEVSISKLMESRASFREEFVKKVPVGSKIVNTNLYDDDRGGSMMWATTQDGEIYKDDKSTLVNVVDINGINGNNGVWTAAFCRLA